MDGISHEHAPTMLGEILPPPEHSPDVFLPPHEASSTEQHEESRKRAASSATIDIHHNSGIPQAEETCQTRINICECW